MYLLLDECCPKSLVAVAESEGHTVQRSIEVPALRRGATDRQIFDWARRHSAILVTINADDFVELAEEGQSHPGILLIPSLRPDALKPLFVDLLKAASPLITQGPDLFVEIAADGAISSFSLP